MSGFWMRRLRLPAAILVAIAVMGCAGGNIFGANPGEGGCGARPDGLIAGDIVGSWRGENGVTFTLRADGTFELTSPAPSPSGSPGPVKSSRPDRSSGRWELLATTDHRDLNLNVERSDARNHPDQWQLFVTGTRTEPWLYTFEGDPDSCSLLRYDRVAA